MYELPSLHFSRMAEELYAFTRGVAVYSSGAPGYVLVSVCLPLVTPSLTTPAIWMSSESRTNTCKDKAANKGTAITRALSGSVPSRCFRSDRQIFSLWPKQLQSRGSANPLLYNNKEPQCASAVEG